VFTKCDDFMTHHANILLCLPCRFDKQKFFAYPILAEEVKDYHDVIKDPICFQTISEKLNAHQYQSVEQFVVRCLFSVHYITWK